MGIHAPLDLGRDQAGVDEALAYLRDHDVIADFLDDPKPEVLAAVQELLDRVLGRGVCRVLGSGCRLRHYGLTDVVPDHAGGMTMYIADRSSMAGVVRALHLAIRQDASALGIADAALSQVWCLARVARELVVNLLGLPQELANRGDELATALIRLLSDVVDRVEPEAPELVKSLAALPYLVGPPRGAA